MARRPVPGQLPAFAAEDIARTEARASEYVPTPHWVPVALVLGMRAAGHPPLPLTGPRIEPAAGYAAIVDALDLVTPPGLWTLCELREDAALHLSLCGPIGSTVRRGDYLTHGSGITGAGLWITNPPWSLAAEFWAKMLQEAAGIGTVALHVPWSFAATEALDQIACDLYPIEGRPYPFARETCWIVAGPERGGRRLRLKKP